MLRVKFQKGEQRKFLKEVLKKINCPSLRELGNRLAINYSTLKNYFSEERCLPDSLFNDICYISKINKEDLKIEYLNSNWGQVKGGKISRKINKN
ncbi:MAG: hypothetical protein NTZ83_06645 [Candidatus Pacearchaeota archaeon]|nr:hypothetical protein [Candidatus Pacearchaeota archaeon]